MPRRTDLKRVLIIGSGPIVIGQACEFDYSGTQACKALRAEGFEVVLVTSQNHGFAVAPSEERAATHESLYDGTVEGLDYPELNARSAQFHPEASPGPHDAASIIGSWVEGLKAA